MDETCRLRRGEGYGVCADAVVSKCALTGEKRGSPRFPGDLPADSIVLRQLLHQVILQRRQLHRPHLRQYFLQNRALLNKSARSGFALLDSVSGLCFLKSVLRLQQFLLCLCHKKISSLPPLPDDLKSQRVGKLDGFDIAQGLPLELV